MYLKTLTLENVRNLKKQSLEPGSQQNLIIGPNGSGKTSLLEAIHLLCVSRSFRTHRIDQVYTRGTGQLRVTGSLYDAERGREIPLGVAKAKGFQEIHVDRRRIGSISELTQFLPVVVLNPEAHELLEQGPKQRRQFVDWGLFHVEPGFLSVWKEFYRVLRQRNAALRQSRNVREAAAWDPAYLAAAQRLHRMRQDYIERIRGPLQHFCELLLEEEGDFDYRQGWQQNHSLGEALNQQLDKDQERGFTHSGPHRADIRIQVGNESAQAYLSRGQQKLMVCAMRLAQVRHLRDRGKDSLLLVDDLPSELDVDRRQRLLAALAQLRMQSFITATEAEAVPDNGVPTKRFHVEQGTVQS